MPRADNYVTLMFRLSENPGSHKLPERSRPTQVCREIALRFLAVSGTHSTESPVPSISLIGHGYLKRSCRVSGRHSPVCHYRGPGLILGQSMWDCGGRSGTGSGFSPSTLVLPCHYNYTNAPYSSPTLFYLNN